MIATDEERFGDYVPSKYKYYVPNSDKIAKIKIDDGEILCKTCNGYGTVIVKYITPYSDRYDSITICLKCKGHGKIDWVTDIMENNK